MSLWDVANGFVEEHSHSRDEKRIAERFPLIFTKIYEITKKLRDRIFSSPGFAFFLKYSWYKVGYLEERPGHLVTHAEYSSAGRLLCIIDCHLSSVHCVSSIRFNDLKGLHIEVERTTDPWSSLCNVHNQNT